MAFVNEYASDEDIEKYKLNKIWDRYFIHEKGKYFRGSKPSFTIDREKEIFLMVLGGGAVEAGYQYKFLLCINGIELLAYVNKLGGSADLSESPYRIVWSLVKVDKPSEIGISESDIFEIIKEALIVYGYRGAKKQLPNTVVEFK